MIYLSVCSRSSKCPQSLKKLKSWVEEDKENIKLLINYDSPSIYEGHRQNLNYETFIQDNDIIVLCHDDIEILSTHQEFHKWLEICNKPQTGFIGVAGAAYLNKDAVWWESRKSGESRGMVFQGMDNLTMTPNYFGRSGQVVVLDGCFIAINYKKLKNIDLTKPDYITNNWDFYDIHLTFTAHLKGYNNYVVPILIRHDSPGYMREGWYQSRTEFTKYHNKNLPCRISMDRTNGLPN